MKEEKREVAISVSTLKSLAVLGYCKCGKFYNDINLHYEVEPGVLPDDYSRVYYINIYEYIEFIKGINTKMLSFIIYDKSYIISVSKSEAMKLYNLGIPVFGINTNYLVSGGNRICCNLCCRVRFSSYIYDDYQYYVLKYDIEKMNLKLDSLKNKKEDKKEEKEKDTMIKRTKIETDENKFEVKDYEINTEDIPFADIDSDEYDDDDYDEDDDIDEEDVDIEESDKDLEDVYAVARVVNIVSFRDASRLLLGLKNKCTTRFEKEPGLYYLVLDPIVNLANISDNRFIDNGIVYATFGESTGIISLSDYFRGMYKDYHAQYVLYPIMLDQTPLDGNDLTNINYMVNNPYEYIERLITKQKNIYFVSDDIMIDDINLYHITENVALCGAEDSDLNEVSIVQTGHINTRLTDMISNHKDINNKLYINIFGKSRRNNEYFENVNGEIIDINTGKIVELK